jgi:hypothetical protein
MPSKQSFILVLIERCCQRTEIMATRTRMQRTALARNAMAPSIAYRSIGYLKVATSWIELNRERPSVAFALTGLRFHLEGSGRAQPAMDIKRLPRTTRAKFAFARLREAGIKPERLLAINLACSACLKTTPERIGQTSFSSSRPPRRSIGWLPDSIAGGSPDERRNARPGAVPRLSRRMIWI